MNGVQAVIYRIIRPAGLPQCNARRVAGVR